MQRLLSKRARGPLCSGFVLPLLWLCGDTRMNCEAPPLPQQTQTHPSLTGSVCAPVASQLRRRVSLCAAEGFGVGDVCLCVLRRGSAGVPRRRTPNFERRSEEATACCGNGSALRCARGERIGRGLKAARLRRLVLKSGLFANLLKTAVEKKCNRSKCLTEMFVFIEIQPQLKEALNFLGPQHTKITDFLYIYIYY